MEEIVSAADANRHFSRILRAVREGHVYIVTSHDKPIAKIVPVGRYDNVRVEARSALLARLRSKAVVDIGPWTREELYEDQHEGRS